MCLHHHDLQRAQITITSWRLAAPDGFVRVVVSGADWRDGPECYVEYVNYRASKRSDA